MKIRRMILFILGLIIGLAIAIETLDIQFLPQLSPSLSDQIKAAGLEIESVRDLPDNELPPGTNSGQQFVLPAHCGPDCGGKILIFDNDTDALKMAQLWEAMGQYVFVKDGTLLQINGTVESGIAKRYGEVLLK